MHPVTLAVTTGRCGTTFLEKTFKKNFQSDNNWISHEHLKQKITNVGIYHRCYSKSCHQQMLNGEISKLLNTWKAIHSSGPIVDFGWTMRSLIPYFYNEFGGVFRVLHIHRHPIEVAASFKLIGSYSKFNSPQWAITPFHPKALFPQFKQRWNEMTAFEKCLYLWLEVNGSALELRDIFPSLPLLEVRSSQMFEQEAVVQDISQFTGFNTLNQPIEASKEKNERDLFSLERNPVREEWRQFKKHPELVEFAERLGYCMEEDYIEQFIWKYQLPKGIVPLIRNKTGYWKHRENIGKFLRKMGLRN